jgi:hypothetical protein
VNSQEENSQGFVWISSKNSASGDTNNSKSDSLTGENYNGDLKFTRFSDNKESSGFIGGTAK